MAGQLHNNVNILNANEVLNATVHLKLVKMVNCVMCTLPQLKRNHVKNHSCTDSRLYWWGYQPSFFDACANKIDIHPSKNKQLNK